MRHSDSSEWRTYHPLWRGHAHFSFLRLPSPSTPPPWLCHRGRGPGMAHYGVGHTLAHQHHLYSIRPNAQCDAPIQIQSPPRPPLLHHRRLVTAGRLPVLSVSRLRLSLPCPCLSDRPGPGLQASSGVWAPPLRPPGPVGTGQCPLAQARGCAPTARTVNTGCQ
jgi:hypothetical protein